MKSIKRCGAIYVRQVLLPELTEWVWHSLFGKSAAAEISMQAQPATVPDWDPVVLHFRFNSVLPQFAGLSQTFQLKISCRPYQQASIVIRQEPLLYHRLAAEKRESGWNAGTHSIFIKAIPVQQTLMEKMLLLHECFQQKKISLRQLSGQSRHLMDIARLVNVHPKMICDLQAEEFNRLRVHRKFWYRQKEVNYAQIKMSRLCFIPPLEVLGILMDDFRTLKQHYLFSGSSDYAALIGQIQETNQLLNGNNWPRAKMKT